MSLREGCALPQIKMQEMWEKRHLKKMCQSTKFVHTIESSPSEEETFSISTVKKSPSTPTPITFKVNQQHTITFEIDTGASCNILPLSDYVKATGDTKGHKLKKTATCLTMHNNLWVELCFM